MAGDNKSVNNSIKFSKKKTTAKNNSSGLKSKVKSTESKPSKIKFAVTKPTPRNSSTKKTKLVKGNTAETETKTTENKKEADQGGDALHFNLKVDENKSNTNESKSQNKPKMDLHLSLNLNETLQSVRGGGGFLEISSGLVPLKRQKNSAFHISFDETLPMNESGIRIRNQIFDHNDEWNFKKTSPGRYEQPSTTNKGPSLKFIDFESSQVDFSYSPLNIEITNSGCFISSQIPANKNGQLNASSESNLSFLFNQHTGFLCKNCFSSSCIHIQSITRLSKRLNNQKLKKKKKPKCGPNSKIKKSRKKNIKKSKGNCLESEVQLSSECADDKEPDEDFCKSSSMHITLNSKPELESLLVPLLKQINENYVSEISLSDFFTLIEFNDALGRDCDPNTAQILVATDLTSESPNITQEKNINDSLVPPSADLKCKNLQKRPGSKSSFYYDSDYDDASYLDACQFSKSQISIDELEISNGSTSKEVVKETLLSEREPVTPPNLSSTPNDRVTDNSFLKSISKKRRASLRPSSDLQPVIESEEHYTSTSSHRSGSLDSNILSQKLHGVDFSTSEDFHKSKLNFQFKKNSSVFENFYINILDASNSSELQSSVVEKIKAENASKNPNVEIRASEPEEAVEIPVKRNENSYARLSLKELKKLAKRHLKENYLKDIDNNATRTQTLKEQELDSIKLRSLRKREESVLSATAFEPFQADPPSCSNQLYAKKMLNKKSVAGVETPFTAISPPNNYLGGEVKIISQDEKSDSRNDKMDLQACSETKTQNHVQEATYPENILNEKYPEKNIISYESETTHHTIASEKNNINLSVQNDDYDYGYTPDQDEQLQLQLQEQRMKALNESYFKEYVSGSDKDTQTDDEEVNQINRLGDQTIITQKTELFNPTKNQERLNDLLMILKKKEKDFMKSYAEQSTNTEPYNIIDRRSPNSRMNGLYGHIDTLLLTTPRSNSLQKQASSSIENGFVSAGSDVHRWLARNYVLENDSGVDSCQERTVINSTRDSQIFSDQKRNIVSSPSQNLDTENSMPITERLSFASDKEARNFQVQNLSYLRNINDTRDSNCGEKHFTPYRNLHYTNDKYSSFPIIKTLPDFQNEISAHRVTRIPKSTNGRPFLIDSDAHFYNNLPNFAPLGSKNKVFIPRPPLGSNRGDSYIRNLSAKSRDDLTKSPTTVYIKTIDCIKSSSPPKFRKVNYHPPMRCQSGRWKKAFGPSTISDEEMTSYTDPADFNRMYFPRKFYNNDIKVNSNKQRKFHHERYLFIKKTTDLNHDCPLYLTTPCRTLKSRRCQYVDKMTADKNVNVLDI